MGNVNEIVLALDEEMVVLAHVGIEICFRSVYRDLAQKSGVREQVERVVNSGKRDRDLRLDRFLIQHLGGEMPVSFTEQHPPQRQTLLGWAQACLAQQSLDIAPAATGGGGPAMTG